MDDGARNMGEALAMARIAVNSGITDMVATPHCERGGIEEIQNSYRRLCRAVEEEGIPLKLHLGMEIFATEDTARLLKQGQLLTLNGSRYPLVEFDFLAGGEQETDILQDICAAGYRPLVAHPERYLFLRKHPDLMNIWWDMGCLFQVNRGSLVGRFGIEAQQLALEMVDRGFATVVSSDAHSSIRRTPWMEQVGHMLRREFSSGAALYLLERNPEAILNDKELTPMDPHWF
jgi:protein-tyrosine phosphatase